MNRRINDGIIIDITDHNVTREELAQLKLIGKESSEIFIQDTNWFGGIWYLQDFIAAEEEIDEFVDTFRKKNLSPFENFICAYYYASNRPYKLAPEGSSFQSCRSFVDVITKGYCVCVGYGTVLKRCCDKLGIECAVQGCFAKDKFGNIINHANNLVYLCDPKYNIDGLYYSDPRMDCLGFQDVADCKGGIKLNMLAIPITDIGKIVIEVWNDDTIIEMNDFQSIYYTRTPLESDLNYFSKFFTFNTINEIVSKKYCDKITHSQIIEALKSIGFSQEHINQTMTILETRSKFFFTNNNLILTVENEWNQRLEFVKYLEAFLNHKGISKEYLDCATFVRYVFKNFFDMDIMQNGYGNSWTGKIMTSSTGKIKTIEENSSIQDKIKFIDTKCKIGDVLLFHRQSKTATETSIDNWYPGHCGIYLGNHKYVDSRLTTRGNIDIVDIDNDSYMQYFIGTKDFISVNKEKKHSGAYELS